VLVTTPGSESVTVVRAELSGGNGSWNAQAELEGYILPNTRFTYQFRATDAAGASVLSESAEVVVTDDRFEWKTLTGEVVRLHWYSGDEGFARRALDIGDQAVANAAELLGVTESEPIDFFIYDDQARFTEALGPGTRENVGGRAVASNRTMYGLIRPSQVNEDWVDILVIHELTHLVFDTATENDYHFAPHWLNEGVATYLSEGVSERWRSTLNLGLADKALIPLQGMVGGFGAGNARFDLGYAESVSAVDFLVKAYGEPKLWQLVRSYAEGLSDDDAFTRATGVNLAGFNAAWMESLNAEVPAELGPRPGPTGPVPPDWLGQPPATPGPVVTPGAPRPTRAPSPAPGGPGSGGSPGSDVPGVGTVSTFVLATVIVLVAIWIAIRRRRRRPEPEPPPPSWPPEGWPPAG
jgi:hypothetical protein